MQLPLKADSLRRFDWRRGIFAGWGLGAIFFLLFLLMPQGISDLLSQTTTAIFPTLDGDEWLGILTSAGIYILMALGLNVVVGFAGLLDLGYAAFFAIGAYTYGIVNFGTNHVPVWPLLLAAPIVAAMFGVMLGAPTLRLRGDYLAIVTLGFGEIVPIVFKNLNTAPLPILGTVEIGGVNGLSTRSPTPLVFPFGTYTFNLATTAHDDVTNFYYLVFGLVVLATIGVVLLRSSRIGRAWVAIREDETAAACSGINLVATKLTAFAIGASVSGFAGVLYGAQILSISPEQFGFTVSITVLVMIVLGGMGSIPGVITGALLLSILDRFLAIIPTAIQVPSSALHFLNGKTFSLCIGPVCTQSYDVGGLINNSEFLIFGALLLVMILLRPQGLIPSALRKRELKGEAVAVVDGKEVIVPAGAPESAATIESFQELEEVEAEALAAPVESPGGVANYLVDGINKVNELVVKLGRFYQAHPETDNEILLNVASNLTGYSLALTQILDLSNTSVLGNTQKAELLKLLKKNVELLGKPVEEEVKRSLQEPNIRCEEAKRLFIRQMNMYFDIGTEFLMRREMKESGFSDAMIEEAVSQDRPNVF